MFETDECSAFKTNIPFTELLSVKYDMYYNKNSFFSTSLFFRYRHRPLGAQPDMNVTYTATGFRRGRRGGRSQTAGLSRGGDASRPAACEREPSPHTPLQREKSVNGIYGKHGRKRNELQQVQCWIVLVELWRTGRRAQSNQKKKKEQQLCS